MLSAAEMGVGNALLARMEDTFEAMGKGKPGLTVAAIRVLVLSAPFAWGGMRIAREMGEPRIYGLIIGLQVVTLVSSVVFYSWFRRSFRRTSETGRRTDFY